MTYLSQDDAFHFEYSRFKLKNPERNQTDFLEMRIKEVETALSEYERVRNFNDEEFLEFLKKSNYRNFNSYINHPKREVIIKEYKRRYELNKPFIGAVPSLNYYKLHLETLTTRSKNNLEHGTNPYPLIFTGDDCTNFQIFDKYLKRHLIDLYGDISFLFQKMLSEERLYKISHLDFVKWLEQINYITSEDLDMFIGKETLSKKYNSKNRVKNYQGIVQDTIEMQ